MDSRNMNTAPGKVLLSGASGMLGTALRTALERRNAPGSQQVLQLVRRPPQSRGELQWNPTDSKPIVETEPLEGLDAVIHLSGANVAAHRWTAEYKREITASRVDSTYALATMLADLHRPPQALLVASATGIYGDRGEEILDENSSPGSGFLADVCRAWEAAAQPAIQAGIRVVHLRFGVVVNHGAGALEKMLPVFRLGLGGRLGSGRQWMSWIELADLVAGVLFAQGQPSLTGPLNLVAPHPVTNAQFTRALAHQLHRPAVMQVPAFALRLAMGEMADEALLASARVVPRKLLDAGFQFKQPTVEEALAAALQ